MTQKTFEVKHYEVRLGFEYPAAAGPKSRGWLVCMGDDGYHLNIYFAAPGSEMKPPQYSPGNKWGSINVPIDEMQHYVDLVRNEKPVYARLDSEKPHLNQIYTGQEPVGEEESWGTSDF